MTFTQEEEKRAKRSFTDKQVIKLTAVVGISAYIIGGRKGFTKGFKNGAFEGYTTAYSEIANAFKDAKK